MTDIERKLRTLERREPPELWTEIERRAQSSPVSDTPRRRWTATVVALTASALSLTFVIGVFVRSTDRPVAGSLNPERIDVGIDYLSTEVDIGEDRVWIVTTDADDGWVVASVDPVTQEARRFALGVGDGDGGIGDLAVGAGAVWVTYSPLRDGSYDEEPGVVFRLDLTTGEIVDRFTVGRGPQGIVVTDGVVWIAEQAENRVVRLDASTGNVVGSTSVRAPGRLLEAFGWVWAETPFGTTSVTRLDPSTGNVTGTVAGVHGMSAGPDGLFVSDQADAAVWELDPQTLERDRRVTGLAGENAHVVAGDGQLWIGRWFEESPPPNAEVIPGPLRYGEHRFYRVDPETFEPTGEFVPTCASAGRPAIAYGALWYPCLGDLFRVPLPISNPSPSVTAETVFFPTWSGDERPLALISGVLIERDDCLLIATGVDDALLLWEAGYRYHDGAILDESGTVVARTGDAIQGGGGYVSDWAHAENITGTSIPDRCRPEGVEPFALIYDVERVDESIAPANWDIGLGFPVCDVSRVHGEFGSGRGTAFVATRMGDSGCPSAGDGFQFLAVDASGDGVADGSVGPLDCQPVCRAFAAPDVDGDGTNEVAVAVGSTGGSTLFQLFTVAFASIEELRFDCVDCGQLFLWGRPGGHAEGAYCPAGETPGDFVSWAAEQTDDGSAYAVVEIFIDVKGSFLTEVDQRDSEVPFEQSALPPGGGDDFCGAPVTAAVN